jgi:hypothetical protein
MAACGEKKNLANLQAFNALGTKNGVNSFTVNFIMSH